jgi:hypothetical protein
MIVRKTPSLLLFFICICGYASASVSIMDGYMDKISYSPNEVAAVYLNADSVYTGEILYLFDANGIKVDSVIADFAPQNISSLDGWFWILRLF